MKRKVQKYLLQWNFLRGLKFFFGIVLLAFYIVEEDGFYLGFSLFFLVQSVFNIGCCTAGNCNADVKPTETKPMFKFKELKIDKDV